MTRSSSREDGLVFGITPPHEDDRENQIAARIQASILPREIDIEGIEISAGMLPAESIGGDYYDVIPMKNGCWIGVGDVAGHGLGAGLIMLMIQSTLMGLATFVPNASPRELVCALNRVLFENIRRRLRQDEHTTMCLVKYDADGSLVFAGAHEDIIICRKQGPTELIATRGTWLGAVRDISRATVDTKLQLQPGDIMVLVTDGAIEARNAERVEFGIERLRRIVEENRGESAQVVRNRLMDAVLQWAPSPQDDVTIIAVRCQGIYWES
jgi:phosphoserine phosphatase RsbU/P